MKNSKERKTHQIQKQKKKGTEDDKNMKEPGSTAAIAGRRLVKCGRPGRRGSYGSAVGRPCNFINVYHEPGEIKKDSLEEEPLRSARKRRVELGFHLIPVQTDISGHLALALTPTARSVAWFQFLGSRWT